MATFEKRKKVKEASKGIILKRKSKKNISIQNVTKVAEEKLRGMGEIPFTKEWKIVRSDAHNWTIERYMPERASNRPGHEGRMIAAGWKRQRGFYHDFPSAAMAMVKLMGLDFTDDDYTVKSVKQIISGLQDIKTNIMRVLKKVLTR